MDLSTLEVLDLGKPGIYEIIHSFSNKRYIGESANILSRLGKHLSTLKENVHDCEQLQIEWNNAKLHKKEYEIFSMRIIHIGESWNCLKDRKNQEKRLLKKYSQSELYNFISDRAQILYRTRVSIKGVTHESIRHAAEYCKVSQTTLRRWLQSDKYADCFEMEKLSYGISRCLIDGIEYPSVNAVVEAGIAPNRLFVSRRIKNPKYTTWQSISTKRNKYNLIN